MGMCWVGGACAVAGEWVGVACSGSCGLDPLLLRVHLFRLVSGYPGVCLHISLRHSVYANTEQIHIFPGFSQLLVQCTKMSLPWGGMCMLFEICEKRPFQKCMGWEGIGDHIFEY